MLEFGEDFFQTNGSILHSKLCEIKMYQDVDQLIGGMKKTFFKCTKRTAIFNEICPDLPNPLKSIITRWGT